MPTIQQLRDQRAAAWAQAQEYRDRDTLTAEDEAAWTRALDEVDRLGSAITTRERDEQLDAQFRDVNDASVTTTRDDADGDGERAVRTAFNRYLRGGMGSLEADQRQLMLRQFVSDAQLRAQGVGTSSAGGYLVPAGFRAQIIETLKFFGAVRRVAQVIETDTGNTLPWPTNDDTANVGAILAENTQVTEQDVTLGTNDLGAYMYTSKLVRVSLQLLQDAAFDIEAFLTRKLGERIARIQNQHFTTGTGTAQPEGIQTNAVVGKTGAGGQTTSVIYDDLIDLIHSIDPAYRQGGRVQFMLHDLTLANARKLKDADGRPLWQPSVQAGVPDALLGYPYVVNNDMPVMAANVKSILFGDFQAGYVIRDVLGVQMLRLEERYADFLQVGFLGFARSDATPQDAAAYKAYRNAAA